MVRYDGRVKVWVEEGKTDQRKEVSKFVLTNKKIGKVPVTKLVE